MLKAQYVITIPSDTIVYIYIFQDAKKKREEERQKQLRWREEHTNALLAGSNSEDSGSGGGTQGAQMIRQKRWQRSIKAAGVLQGMLAAPVDDTMQSADSHDNPDFLPTMTKDSSQDDYMDTTAMSSLPQEDYSLQPPSRGRSPYPSKTPPHSPRSPPPPHMAMGRVPQRMPSYQDTSIDVPSEMGGDAVHLIDFDDADREPDLYEKVHSRRGSLAPGTPTGEVFASMASAIMSSRRPSMAPPSHSREQSDTPISSRRSSMVPPKPRTDMGEVPMSASRRPSMVPPSMTQSEIGDTPSQSRRPSIAHSTISQSREHAPSRRPSVAHPSPTPPPRHSPTQSDQYRSHTPTDQYGRAMPTHSADQYRRSHTPTDHHPRSTHSHTPPDQFRSHTPRTISPSRRSPDPSSDPYHRPSLPRQESMASSVQSPHESNLYESLPQSVSKHSIPTQMTTGDEFAEPMSMSQTSASTGSSRHSDTTHAATDTEHDPMRGESTDLIDMDQPDDEESFAMGHSSGDPDVTDEDLKSTRV